MMPINQQLKNDYNEKGYIKIAGFFGDELIRQLYAESQRLRLKGESHSNRIKYGVNNTTSGVQIYRIDPVIDESELISQVAYSSELLNLLNYLEGEEVVLLKDKIIYKPAGSRGFELHQDFGWSEGKFPESLFSVIICLEPANAENGAVEFFAGYHHSLLSNASEARHMNEAEKKLVDVSRGEIINLKPGDLVVFKGLTPHQSIPNNSNTSRVQIFLSFNHKKDGDFYHSFLSHFNAYSAKSRDAAGNYINSYEKSE